MEKEKIRLEALGEIYPMKSVVVNAGDQVNIVEGMKKDGYKIASLSMCFGEGKDYVPTRELF
jgi:hypothetical protein